MDANRVWVKTLLILMCVGFGCSHNQRHVDLRTPQVKQTDSTTVSPTPSPLKKSQAGTTEKELRQLSLDGDPNAQFRLAFDLVHLGSYRKGLSLMRKSASQGNPKAKVARYIQYRMNLANNRSGTFGEALVSGWESNDALSEVEEMASNGDPEAQLLLWLNKWQFGFLPSNNIKWLKKSVEANNPLAKGYLGSAYLTGDGVTPDLDMALHLLNEAAAEGDAAAMATLASVYWLGHMVPQNRALSFKLFNKAAVKGHVLSQLRVATIFFDGVIVKKDPIRAYAWANQFAAHDREVPTKFTHGGVVGQLLGLKKHVTGQWLKRSFAAKMSSEEINAAERLTLSDLAEEPDTSLVEAPETEKEPGPFAEADVSPSPSPPIRRGIRSNGTGFFITANGHLLTNHHVIEKASKIEVILNGDVVPARLIQSEPSLDLAVLKIERQVQPIPLSSSKDARMGDSVFTIGFPNTHLQGVRSKYTHGRISSLSGFQDDPREFQISVPIQPGNSGGPLVDEQGSVVGIVASTLRNQPGQVRQVVNYAVKSSFALAFLETLTDVVELLSPPTSNQATGSENPIRRVNNATVRIRVERIR